MYMYRAVGLFGGLEVKLSADRSLWGQEGDMSGLEPHVFRLPFTKFEVGY